METTPTLSMPPQHSAAPTVELGRQCLCAELNTIKCRHPLREQVEVIPQGLVTEISHVPATL